MRACFRWPATRAITLTLMTLSVFDIFKIGIGPSSSHTMGPMVAAGRFLQLLRKRMAEHPDAMASASLRVTLYGSLAFTGKGHATDRAVAIGLLGYSPADLDPDAAERRLVELRGTKVLHAADLPTLSFDPDSDIVFDYGPALPGHANGVVFEAISADHAPCFSETYYSIGGGFVVTAAERDAPSAASRSEAKDWPYPFDTAASMLHMAKVSGLSIAAMKRANELTVRSPE